MIRKKRKYHGKNKYSWEKQTARNIWKYESIGFIQNRTSYFWWGRKAWSKNAPLYMDINLQLRSRLIQDISGSDKSNGTLVRIGEVYGKWWILVLFYRWRLKVDIILSCISRHRVVKLGLISLIQTTKWCLGMAVLYHRSTIAGLSIDLEVFGIELDLLLGTRVVNKLARYDPWLHVFFQIVIS